MTGESGSIGPEAGRTYSGWKTTLGIIAVIAAVAYAINVLGERTAPRTDRTPPVVTSVTASPAG